MAHETFQVGDLTAVIGDNEGYAGHRAGYYGLFGSHEYILMFDRTDGIRFSHSPSGGGPPSATETAWDWQFIIPEYEVAQEYGYRARVAYRERCSRDEVLEEFKKWRGALGK